MATFTALSAWTSAQDRTATNEIVLAYSERRQCVGDSAVAALAPGGNVQDTAFWTAMQGWVEANCIYFVDDDSFSTSTEYTNVNAIAYTLSNFRTAAEITSGFRRATSWPTDWTDYGDAAYSYGRIQSGDIIGPWIYDDLQKAFDALRWSYAGGNETTGFYIPLLANPSKTPLSLAASNFLYGLGMSSSHVSALAAYNAAVTDWATYTSSMMHGYYNVQYGYIDSDSWSCSLHRQASDADFSAIPTHLAHTAEGYYFVGDNASANDVFEDIDSIGIVEKKMFSKQSFTSATTATRTIDRYTFTTAPSAANADGYVYGAFTKFCAVLVMKWTFTNTL